MIDRDTDIFDDNSFFIIEYEPGAPQAAPRNVTQSQVIPQYGASPPQDIPQPRNVTQSQSFSQPQPVPPPAPQYMPRTAPQPAPRSSYQPLKIEPPEKDEIRELFYAMRNIAKQHFSPYMNFTRIYDKKVRQDNSLVFYKQGIFMKDFTDDYKEQADFSSYFPYYQMMGYGQLRTYFSWRARVRDGNVSAASLSYVFLYIYELLNNIGVESPKDGMDRLLSLRSAFKAFDPSIEKYIVKWLKDYFIYYGLPGSFGDFAQEHGLAGNYVKTGDTGGILDLFCAVSKYDIRKSAFFTADKSKLITDCLYFLINDLRQAFKTFNINFDEIVFGTPKKTVVWAPFKDALFYNWMVQPDRQVILSEKEIYICRQNKWTFGTSPASESGRRFIGYIFKKAESVLRDLTKYKFKLAADINMINEATIRKIKDPGLNLDKIISDSVTEFYREATKTVVTVEDSSLKRIRQEALFTQERLIVNEEDIGVMAFKETPAVLDTVWEPVSGAVSDVVSDAILKPVQLPSSSGGWEKLKSTLNKTELQALAVIFQGGTNIKQFADKNDIMLEVLIDGINEKSADSIGDSLLDDESAIYKDYREQVKEMVESI